MAIDSDHAMSLDSLAPVAVGPMAGRLPLFAWRGLLIDSARTRQPVDVVKQCISLAARYGFNRLHWHLTDGQGWRFEVPAYPRLVEVVPTFPGALRRLRSTVR